jgi:hypothetical protein
VAKAETPRTSKPSAVGSRPSAEPQPELTDAALERAIVDAVTMGLGDVARTLATQLDERKRARAPANVVTIRPRRP